MSLVYKLVAVLVAVVVLTWAIISAAPFIAICTVIYLLYLLNGWEDDEEEDKEKPPD